MGSAGKADSLISDPPDHARPRSDTQLAIDAVGATSPERFSQRALRNESSHLAFPNESVAYLSRLQAIKPINEVFFTHVHSH